MEVFLQKQQQQKFLKIKTIHILIQLHSITINGF